jgi:hypothetical protein
LKFFIFKSVCALLLLLCFRTSPVTAQDKWKFLTEKEGIKVYTKSIPDSKINALKVECTINTTLSALVTLLMDVKAAPQWVYHTKSCVLIQRLSPAELYYYSEVNLPWPLENRDFVAHVKVTQDKATKVVIMEAPAVPGFIAKKKGIVRVDHSVGFWIITPLDKGNVKVEYSLQVNPGGAIPAWAVNLLSSQGPIESFINMRKMLLGNDYRNATLGFIQN